MSDFIARQAAIDLFPDDDLVWDKYNGYIAPHFARNMIENLPSAQPLSKELIARIREWINSGNRGTADYFIVDRIEEIINEYERLNQ